MSEQPGRYQRSFSGMIGALLILLLLIGAFVAFRGLNREELEVEPERVDYLEAVRFAQESDWEVLYPATVPPEWKATSLESTPGQLWAIGFLTPDGFAGMHQSDRPTDVLVETYLDEDAVAGEAVTIEDAQWESFTDEGGDTGYVGEVDGLPVLVYGSASPQALQQLAASLTTRPVADRPAG